MKVNDMCATKYFCEFFSTISSEKERSNVIFCLTNTIKWGRDSWSLKEAKRRIKIKYKEYEMVN